MERTAQLFYGKPVPVKFAEILAQSYKNCSFEVMSNQRFENTIGLNGLDFI